VPAFYARRPPGAVVGIEATFAALWFERLLTECGHELWVGDAAPVRAQVVRQQKTDTRDAALAAAGGGADGGALIND
jgi:transposase